MEEPNHVRSRELILETLRRELVGPSPEGHELDCAGQILFNQPSDAYGPFRQAGSGEEILMRDPPCKRYGIGVLYPLGSDALLDSTEPTTEGPGPGSELETLTESGAISLEEIQHRSRRGWEAEGDDFDLSSANSFKPSSMGISFLVEVPPGSKLVVEVPRTDPNHGHRVNGRYVKKDVVVSDKTRAWYLRQPIYLRAEFESDQLSSPRAAKLTDDKAARQNLDGLDLQIEAYSRPTDDPVCRLITVSLINRGLTAGLGDNESSLFQAYFRCWVESESPQPRILPYPTATVDGDDEEETTALLYRHFQTFAVGHGCAANWETAAGDHHKVSWVSAECLPTHEVPSMTFDIERADANESLRVSMAALAGLVPNHDGMADLEEVILLYERWISHRRLEIPTLETRYKAAALRHLEQASQVSRRMRDGLGFLRSSPLALKAFRLANHAILLQQLRSNPEPRRIQWDRQASRISFSAPAPQVDQSKPHERRGYWRPFQVAFLLMALRSAVDGRDLDRDIVELIWFPTGGGKTEAYLGLAAFAMFMRRLQDPTDDGTHVLMRYTLRLLTAQQFQRAAGLIVAMEYLRGLHQDEFGIAAFSIGIWLGGDSTPNRRRDALSALGKLNKDPSTENPFILTRCPWCGAQIGPIKQKLLGLKSRVLGYERAGETVRFSCTDSLCRFAGGLPVYVIDEDIYEKRPSLLIGTVDKFANLAWRPEVRFLFGLDEDGCRISSPPGLIIQDELHLISGPLGSMVGLFEAVIEELCTDRREGTCVPPKIVCSTATIREYKQQIKSLYGRSRAQLFPPPGLDASDSFFSRYAKNDDGTPARGRMYVGVHGPGLGSMQTTQVRAFSALLQAPMALETAGGRDPWWSLLIFFNSLRELGTTLTLLQSDIPDYFKVLRHRFGVSAPMRSFFTIKELTSRLRGDEVPEAIAELSTPYGSDGIYPVDICLASNIIEVGVDIDRLSLMAIVGQPKSTSQYIQVSGRVGRQGPARPGLVVTLYGAAKPRDRSHFEKFRSYHERLYAQVEPTSVTPFSPPVLDRALHAVMVSFARQSGPRGLAWETPYPYPAQVLDYLRQLLMSRVQTVDPDEAGNFQKVFDKRAAEWEERKRTHWTSSWQDPEIPLIRETGEYANGERALLSWPTPRSMRNVDAECMATVTNAYLLGRVDEK